ncbi:serine/threonine-protein phosphatase [Streptomyces yunnanensis]|uniref:Serine/threonine-protein phosphatase n=1 Tax=Streptomyces yunnanensis TaxID=156453 RepID=A0ABY8AML6_9ACTN|nr:PP2C family protein-serine/threonine phosphatase [Streptomyces yunnanensis]WEB37985.1 serine/threonine-protein phosphatase [Streptomyces yunnanensis]WEB45396.1 serine/threonine-protein phosphatase [Streptomyces yunnanensis]
MRLSPVVLTVVIASLAYTTPPEMAFSRLLPAAPALAAAMWPVLPTVLLGTVCLFLMIGLSIVFPGLGTWWTAAGIIAVTVAAAYGSHIRLQRERTLFQLRLVADAAQQVVLSPMPRRFGSVEIDSLYLAAAAEARIGGDFYEVIDTPYGVRLLIGDVRGKGLPAVGAAAAIVNSFREAAYGEADMVNVARRLDASSTRYNAAFPPEGPMERFATALLAEMPHEGGRIEILNCGHPPPLLLNHGKLRTLEPTTPSPLLNLAGLIGDHYTIDTFDFSPGDLLLLYTDGVTEARARDGEFFPLAAWMRRQPPTPPRELLTALHRDLLHYCKGRLDDDIAALAVRLSEPPE